MNIANSLTELIGNTPLLRADGVLLKLEMFNPAGSVKDRAALGMILDAEQSGRLAPGGVIVEPTSGNTGIGLAWIGRLRGYRVILTMPDTMSLERRQILNVYGAETVLTPGALGMSGAIDKAREIAANTPGAIMMSQFDNPANADIHARTTAREIWRDTDGSVDFFVAGVGSGGTLCGVARELKPLKPSFKAVAVEPAESPVLQGGAAAPHPIQGIGANFVPGNFRRELVDQIMSVTGAEATEATHMLLNRHGVLAGISSGAAFAAARRVLAANPGATVVALLPDTGARYLSTPLFTPVD